MAVVRFYVDGDEFIAVFPTRWKYLSDGSRAFLAKSVSDDLHATRCEVPESLLESCVRVSRGDLPKEVRRALA
jgi:hypothetical protein